MAEFCIHSVAKHKFIEKLNLWADGDDREKITSCLIGY